MKKVPSKAIRRPLCNASGIGQVCCTRRKKNPWFVSRPLAFNQERNSEQHSICLLLLKCYNVNLARITALRIEEILGLDNAIPTLL
jgi:hypothetical protein